MVCLYERKVFLCRRRALASEDNFFYSCGSICKSRDKQHRECPWKEKANSKV